MRARAIPIKIIMWFLAGFLLIGPLNTQSTTGTFPIKENPGEPAVKPPDFKSPIVAVDAPIKNQPAVELIRASEAEYITLQESKESVLILRGGILIRIGDKTLQAETVKMNPATGEIFGEGGVIFKEENATMKGDRFLYDNRNRIGVLFSGDAIMKQIFFSGETLKKVSEKTYVARSAFFTTCEVEKPHYFFKAKKLWMYENNQIAALHVIYYAGQTPVFYWPLMFQHEVGTGIITQYGNDTTRGHFLQNTWYFGISSEKERFYIPQKGKLAFDWYQRLGLYMGTVLEKDTADLAYNLDLALADYKQRDTLSTSSGELIFTNEVKQADGSRQKVHEFWWKTNANIRARWNKSNENDSQSSIYLRFENYKHKNFEMEFGSRYEPDNTIEALYRTRFSQGFAPRTNLLWEAMYSEDWMDNHFSVKVSRQLAWYERAQTTDSAYLPAYDIAPEILFTKRWQLLTASGGLFQGLWNSLELKASLHRYYNQGGEIKTIFANEALDQMTAFITPFSWMQITPSFGYGLISQMARQSDTSLDQETRRQSYQYIFSRDTIRLGYPVFYTEATYLIREGIVQEISDPTFGTQRGHAVTVGAVSDINPFAFLSVYASRDLRKYPYPVPEHYRWSEMVARGNMEYDIIRGFDLNYPGLKKRTFYNFSGLGLSEMYVHSIRFERPATNDVQIYYRLGGYRLWLLRELTSFKVTYNWHQNYIQVPDSQMMFGWDLNILLHHYWRMRMGANSRAEQLERYNASHPAYVPFLEDIGRSLNPFNAPDRTTRVFNLDNIYAELEHDLHRWVLKFSYWMQRRTVYYGNQLRDRLSFYEQTFYFSFQLKDLGGLGIPRTELYRYNPADTGIR